MENMYDFEEQLKDNNLKITAPRKLIYKILMENKHEHLEAGEILDLVKKIDPNIGLATVYRTLDTFMNLDLVTSINNKYEINTEDKKGISPHFICEKCGNVVYVSSSKEFDDMEGRIREISTEQNLEPKEIALLVKVICRDCK